MTMQFSEAFNCYNLTVEF